MHFVVVGRTLRISSYVVRQLVQNVERDHPGIALWMSNKVNCSRFKFGVAGKRASKIDAIVFDQQRRAVYYGHAPGVTVAAHPQR